MAEVNVSHITVRIAAGHPAIYQLEFPADEGYIIGRSDENSEAQMPDIDLASLRGRELGVSRRHAALVRYKSVPHLLDLQSVNGTFLNGRRIVPDTPYPLEAENTIRFGTLQICIECLV
jgi:pSer/pThr/pTyr-binding forkhead associated (FHA) protein